METAPPPAWDVVCEIPFSEHLGSPYEIADHLEQVVGYGDAGTLMSGGTLHVREIMWPADTRARAEAHARRVAAALTARAVPWGFELTPAQVGLALLAPSGQRYAVPVAEVRLPPARPVREELFGR